MMRKGTDSVKKNKNEYKGFFDMFGEFIDDIFADDIGLYAAQSTFYIILSAVPLAMMIIMMLKYFVQVDIQSVIHSLNKMLPSEISNFLSEIVLEVFKRSESTAVFSAVFISLMWSSSKGTMALYCGFNKIYGYTKNLSWTRMRFMSLLYNLLLVVVIVATVIVLVFGNSIILFFDEEFIFAHYLISTFIRFKFLIFFVLLMLGFAALFTVLPQKKNKYRVQLWGGGITAIGWLAVSYGFSVYIEFFPRVSYIYGSLTALMLLMLWLYFCMYTLLIGAEVNKHIEIGYFKRLGMRILRLRVKKRKKRAKNT